MMNSKFVMTVSLLTLILLGVAIGVGYNETYYYMGDYVGEDGKPASEVFNGENWQGPMFQSRKK